MGFGVCCALAVVFSWSASAQAPLENLVIGPLRLNKSVFVDLTGSTNVDGISKKAAKEQGVDREDVYMTYGFRFGISGTVYPDIDLNFNTDLSRERHFVRTDLNDDGEIPFLGNASFLFNRSRGHLRYGIGLTHRATTERDKQEVFVPEARRQTAVREIEQVSDARLNLGWTRGKFSLDGDYQYSMTRFNKEFADGDQNEQTLGFSAQQQLNQIFSLSLTHTLNKTEEVGLANPVDTGWEKTTSALVNMKLLRRPSLTYSVGFEKEDSAGSTGQWDQIHNVNLSDTRSIGSNIHLQGSGTYSYETQPEADDITFVYTFSASHQMPHGFSQTLTLTREPVSTFGSTTDSDQTTYSYSLNKSQLFLINMSASLSAQREITKPKTSQGESEPEETLDEYIFNLNWTGGKQLGRWLSLKRDYQYIYTDSSDEGQYDEHRVTLGLEAQL